MTLHKKNRDVVCNVSVMYNDVIFNYINKPDPV
jgi:hypothetical protein